MPSPPPPASSRTAYDVLGVPRTASADDIKKRYRELARKHHPDVNRNDPAAAHRFAEISEAYRTLSDADSRRTLDAEILLREQRAEQTAARARAASGGNSTAYNSRTAPPPRPGSAGGAANPRPGTAAANLAESVRLTAEGRSAYNRDRPIEARTLAEQALRLNRRSAEAWELLGDVFRRQGKTDEAINAYSMCLQINPRNGKVMQLLERMARASGGGGGPTAQNTYYDNRGVGSASSYGAGRGGSAYPGYGRPSPGGSRPTVPTGRVSRLSDEKRPWGRLLASLVGFGAALLTILWMAIDSGDPPRHTFLIGAISDWNANILTALAFVGAILGATMTISGAIRRIDDELILSGVSQRGGAFLPLGLLLIVLSVVNFYAAAVVYAVVSLLQESFTRSMMLVFGAVAIATGLLALVYPYNHAQVFLFGGNVVFITFVVGWLLGDFFRSDIL